MSPEQWRPVPFDHRYEVSDQGRVRSWTQPTRAGAIRRDEPKFLADRSGRDGKLRVSIGGRNYLVHRLVLLAFVGPPPPDKPLGLHENDVPDDNRLSNLRWGTHAENKVDSVRNGTAFRPRGELSVRARLTWEQVREIRRMPGPHAVAAARFGVSASCISHIRNGHTWREAA